MPVETRSVTWRDFETGVEHPYEAYDADNGNCDARWDFDNGPSAAPVLARAPASGDRADFWVLFFSSQLSLSLSFPVPNPIWPTH